jgi:hypothetical protein
MSNHTDDRSDSGNSQSGTPGSDDPSRDGDPGRDSANQSRSTTDAGADDGAHRRSRHEHRHRGRERHGRHGRKERVLHTRISEQLSDDIRRLAEDLRVPTSNLVRNVLEEVFTVVESVSDDVGDLFEDVLEEAESARQRIRRRSRPRSGFTRGREERASSWADVAEEEIRRDEAKDQTARAAPSADGAPPPSPEPAEERQPHRAFEEVIGWQPLVLNQTQDCASCSKSIRRGSRAFVGQTENGLSRIALCKQCLHDR